MYVVFTQLFMKDEEQSAYLEKKWGQVITNPVHCFERGLDARFTKVKDLAGIFLGEAALPAHNQQHREVVSEMADKTMALLEGESLTAADTLDVLGEDAFGAPRHTLVLRRTTNMSESVYVVVPAQVVGGAFYRYKSCVQAHEKVLATLPGATVLTEETECLCTDVDEIAVAPITMSLIAGKIAWAILSGALSQVGSKAMSWAMAQMGIGDINKQSQLSYDQLVEALKRQSRADFRRDLQIKFNEFYRLQQDINGGLRTEPMLDKLYHEIRSITAWLEFEEREPDRLHQLAFAQSLYLATMQELAEFWREKDPEKMKQFYQAQSARAGEEIKILQRVQKEAYDQRMAHIRGLLDRWHPLSDYRVVWFDDLVQPREPSWELAEIRCTQRNIRTGICEKWHWTDKGRGTRSAVQGRLNRHRSWIHDTTNQALNIDEAVKNFTKIRDRRNPPPPPK